MTGEAFDLIVTPQPGSMISNVAELKAWVDKAAEPYLGQLITEEQAKFAKKDLADLRKLRTALEDERKRAKAIIMKPYTDFEALYKEALASLDQAIAGIDTQVKEIEARMKKEKEESLVAFIRQAAQEVGGNSLAAILARDDVMSWFLDPKWLLASAAKSTVERTVRENLVTVAREAFNVEQMCGEDYAACIDVYYQTGSLSEALSKHTMLEKIRKDKAAAEATANTPAGVPVDEPREQGLFTQAWGQADQDSYESRKPEQIIVDVPEEPSDPALLEEVRMPVVLCFPKYRKAMVKEIMTKAGIRMLRPEGR